MILEEPYKSEVAEWRPFIGFSQKDFFGESIGEFIIVHTSKGKVTGWGGTATTTTIGPVDRGG